MDGGCVLHPPSQPSHTHTHTTYIPSSSVCCCCSMFGIRFGCLACSTKRECQICSLVLRARHVEWITRLQFYDINLLEHLRKVFRTFFFLFVPAQTFVQTEYMLLYLGDGRSCLFIVMNAAGSRGRVVIFNFITHIWVPTAAAPKWTPFISVSNHARWPLRAAVCMTKIHFNVTFIKDFTIYADGRPNCNTWN